MVGVKSVWNPNVGIHILSKAFTTDISDWSFVKIATSHLMKTSVRTRTSSLPSFVCSNVIKAIAITSRSVCPHPVSFLFGSDDTGHSVGYHLSPGASNIVGVEVGVSFLDPSVHLCPELTLTQQAPATWIQLIAPKAVHLAIC
ncbi:hypothetical protein RRG08_055210 [Elysia crispata]|uniref:Uncharacterized protein n=1 Tax=Elysia crispata TaxID=231223 RepID=A0AAE1CLS8_9GAST|nr:hypothetical protein RRG08_055210 [Elysia crispata]